MNRKEISNIILFLFTWKKALRRIIFLLLSCVLGWISSLNAQTISAKFKGSISELNYIAEHWSLESGLPVNSVREGMEKVKSDLPDIIISDIMMADGDGLSLLRKIRSQPDFDFLPVILLTAKAGGRPVGRLADWGR